MPRGRSGAADAGSCSLPARLAVWELPDGWAHLNAVDLAAEFRHRVPAMRSVPARIRQPYVRPQAAALGAPEQAYRAGGPSSWTPTSLCVCCNLCERLKLKVCGVGGLFAGALGRGGRATREGRCRSGDGAFLRPRPCEHLPAT